MDQQADLIMGMGSTCATCGFRYWEHRGHLIPCPVCALQSQESVRSEALGQIIEEIHRATDKFPTWPTDPLHAVAVLGEEFGELTQAILQLVYEPHKSSAQEVRKEALQTAAMAFRLYASLDRYEYKPGIQHEQSALSHASEDVHSTELRK